MQLHARNQVLPEEFQFNIYSFEQPRRINLTLFLAILGCTLAQFVITVEINNLDFSKLSFMLIAKTFLSLAAACFAMKWVEKKIWMRENIIQLALSRKSIHQEYLILLLCLITFGTSLILVFNLGLVEDYLADYLTAINMSEPEKWSQIYGRRTLRDVESVLNMILLSYRVFEGFIGIYFAAMCKFILDSLMDSAGTNNLLIDFTHGVVCILGLVVYLVGTMVDENRRFYHSAGFEFEIDPLKFIGLYFLIFSMSSWIIVRKKWRVPSIIFILLGLIGISTGIYFIISMQPRIARGLDPKDIISPEDLKTVDMVSMIPQDEIFDLISVEKYAMDELCPDFLKVEDWEACQKETSGGFRCLNPAALQILSFFTFRIYIIFTSFVIYLIIVNSFLVYEAMKIYEQPQLILTREIPKCFIGVFCAIILLIGIGLSRSRVEVPKLDSPEFTKLEVNNFIARNQELAYTMFMRPVINEQYYNTITDPVTKYDLYTFFVFKSDKFMILRLPDNNLDAPYIYSRGDRVATYDDFLDSVKKIKHGMCLVWLKVEHVQRLVIIRFIKEGVSPTITNGYPSKVSLKNEMGFLTASTVDDLKLEKVLQTVKEIFKLKNWEQDKSGVDDLTRIFNMAEDIQLPTENMIITREGVPVFSNQLFYQKVGEIMDNHTCKFVTSTMKQNNTIDVLKIGYKGANYLHFVEAMNVPKFRLGVIDFVYEGVHQPIAVVWEYKQLNKDVLKYLEEPLNWFINRSIPIMIPKTMLEMNLNFMIEYGAEPDPQKRKEKAIEIKGSLLHF